MLKTTKISNAKVEVLQLGKGEKQDKRPILGSEYIPTLHGNIFEIAKTGSGKTFTTATIIKNCAGPDTKIIVFCSTIDGDKAWIEIRDKCEAKGMDFEMHTTFVEDGVHVLKEIVDELQAKAKAK